LESEGIAGMKRTPLDEWIFQKHGIRTDDRQAVASYQLERIRELIGYARSRSPFYRQLYGGAALPASMEAFSRFPTVHAGDLTARGYQMLCVSQSEIARIVTLRTSGTTQAPKRVYFTRDDVDLTLDFFENGMKTLGGSGDRALILFPAKAPESVGDLLSEALRRLGMTVCCEEGDGAVRRLLCEPVDIVCGSASRLLGVASGTRGVPIRAVLSSSEPLSEDGRAALQSAWRCRVFDHFGMTETGYGGAVECEAHEGMHIRENDLYFEVIDGDGRRLPDGTPGELAVTTLTRRGMPLIRYRTGDRAVLSGEDCPCGSRLRRILKVERMTPCR